jgi:hypothetical protein
LLSRSSLWSLVKQAPSFLTGYSEGHSPPGMSGTGPSAGPPDSSILSLGEGLEGLGEAVAGVVDVVVGAGEAVAVEGVGVSVVISCASTVGGDSHAARIAKPVAKTIRATAAISRTDVRSAIFSPSLGSSRQLIQTSA